MGVTRILSLVVVALILAAVSGSLFTVYFQWLSFETAFGNFIENMVCIKRTIVVTNARVITAYNKM